MKIIEKLHKRRALNSYVKVLPVLLKKKYGKHKRYTEKQVRKAAELAGLNEKYLNYALAMYVSRGEFEALNKVRGLSCEYEEIRQEVANRFFGGDTKFTIHDAVDAARTFSDSFGGGGDFNGGFDSDSEDRD